MAPSRYSMTPNESVSANRYARVNYNGQAQGNTVAEFKRPSLIWLARFWGSRARSPCCVGVYQLRWVVRQRGNRSNKVAVINLAMGEYRKGAYAKITR